LRHEKTLYDTHTLKTNFVSVKMSAFPPHKTLASVPVTQEIALKFLSTYLEATKSTPYLLPNARLEPSGPTAGATSSATTVRNLERVQAGLRGEWLAPVLDLSEDRIGVGIVQSLEGQEGDKMEVDGWQDLDEYQREQSIEEGEVGPRQSGVAQEGDSEFEGRVNVEVADEETPRAKKIKTKHVGGMNGKAAKLDKKAAKKLRLKEEKKKRREEKAKVGE
jgi:hypothetical protein